MNVLYSLRERQIAFCLVVILLFPLRASAMEVGQSPAADAAQAGSTQQSSPTTALTNPVPADKHAVDPNQQNPDASAPKPASAQPGTPDQQTSSSSTEGDQTPQNRESTPIGTAAAPYEKQEGVTATKPSGEAIAPGKQRRNHSFAIRVGLLVGAAAAIGIVTGASLGSPSRAN